MSITKNQLYAINSGALSKIGQNAEDPSFKGTTLLEEMLKGVAQELTDALKQDIVQKKKASATGNLIQSLNAERTYATANGATAEIRADAYWFWVDKGRKRGGRPPIASIEEWISAKGIAVRQSNEESTQSVLERRKSFAIAIANKIAAKGTIKRFGYKGADFVADVLNPTTINAIAEHLGEALGQRIAISVKMAEGTPQT